MIEVVKEVLLASTSQWINDTVRVSFVIDNNQLRLVARGEYHDTFDADGSFMLDIVQARLDRTLPARISDLAIEAQVIIQGIIAKGYEPTTTGIIDVDALTNDMQERAQLAFTRQLAQAFMSATTDAPAGSFDVEVIGMEQGRIKVAKVLADFSYDVVGYAQNDEELPAKIGDIVRVAWFGSRLTLTRLAHA